MKHSKFFQVDVNSLLQCMYSSGAAAPVAPASGQQGQLQVSSPFSSELLCYGMGLRTPRSPFLFMKLTNDSKTNIPLLHDTEAFDLTTQVNRRREAMKDIIEDFVRENMDHCGRTQEILCRLDGQRFGTEEQFLVHFKAQHRPAIEAMLQALLDDMETEYMGKFLTKMTCSDFLTPINQPQVRRCWDYPSTLGPQLAPMPKMKTDPFYAPNRVSSNLRNLFTQTEVEELEYFLFSNDIAILPPKQPVPPQPPVIQKVAFQTQSQPTPAPSRAAPVTKQTADSPRTSKAAPVSRTPTEQVQPATNTATPKKKNKNKVDRVQVDKPPAPEKTPTTVTDEPQSAEPKTKKETSTKKVQTPLPTPAKPSQITNSPQTSQAQPQPTSSQPHPVPPTTKQPKKPKINELKQLRQAHEQALRFLEEFLFTDLTEEVLPPIHNKLAVKALQDYKKHKAREEEEAAQAAEEERKRIEKEQKKQDNKLLRDVRKEIAEYISSVIAEEVVCELCSQISPEVHAALQNKRAKALKAAEAQRIRQQQAQAQRIATQPPLSAPTHISEPLKHVDTTRAKLAEAVNITTSENAPTSVGTPPSIKYGQNSEPSQVAPAVIVSLQDSDQTTCDVHDKESRKFSMHGIEKELSALIDDTEEDTRPSEPFIPQSSWPRTSYPPATTFNQFKPLFDSSYPLFQPPVANPASARDVHSSIPLFSPGASGVAPHETTYMAQGSMHQPVGTPLGFPNSTVPSLQLPIPGVNSVLPGNPVAPFVPGINTVPGVPQINTRLYMPEMEKMFEQSQVFAGSPTSDLLQPMEPPANPKQSNVSTEAPLLSRSPSPSPLATTPGRTPIDSPLASPSSTPSTSRTPSPAPPVGGAAGPVSALPTGNSVVTNAQSTYLVPPQIASKQLPVLSVVPEEYGLDPRLCVTVYNLQPGTHTELPKFFVDCNISKIVPCASRTACFIEFKTSEDTARALTFNGMKFGDNVIACTKPGNIQTSGSGQRFIFKPLTRNAVVDAASRRNHHKRRTSLDTVTQEAVTGTSPVSVNKLEALQPPAVQVQPYAVTPTPESVPVPPVPVPPNPAVMAIPSLPSHIFEQGFNPIAPEFHPARRNNGRGVNIQRPPTVYMPPYISPPGAFPEGRNPAWRPPPSSLPQPLQQAPTQTPVMPQLMRGVPLYRPQFESYPYMQPGMMPFPPSRYPPNGNPI